MPCYRAAAVSILVYSEFYQYGFFLLDWEERKQNKQKKKATYFFPAFSSPALISTVGIGYLAGGQVSLHQLSKPLGSILGFMNSLSRVCVTYWTTKVQLGTHFQLHDAYGVAILYPLLGTIIGKGLHSGDIQIFPISTRTLVCLDGVTVTSTQQLDKLELMLSCILVVYSLKQSSAPCLASRASLKDSLET